MGCMTKPAAGPAGPKALKLSAGLLKADPKNPRMIEAPALRGLGVSMETFGDLSGLVWNEKTGHLVAGHQRMNRLKAAGADEWTREGNEGFVTHPKTGEVFKIRIVDWDETTERMANLSANNPEIQGEFTEEAALQLRELEGEAKFDELMLKELQADLDKETRRLEDEEDADEPEGFAAKYMVVVDCRDESQQSELLERLTAEGFKVRALLQ
jgi:hypothetical protein